jgi:hypothetical protein
VAAGPQRGNSFFAVFQRPPLKNGITRLQLRASSLLEAVANCDHLILILRPASSSSKSTISLICTRNQRSIFVSLKISPMVKPAPRAQRSFFGGSIVAGQQ